MTEFHADVWALRSATGQLRPVVGRLPQIRTDLGGAAPPAEAFGRLPESRAVANKHYMETMTMIRDLLGSAAGSLTKVFDVLQTASYGPTDAEIGDRMRALGNRFKNENVIERGVGPVHPGPPNLRPY